MVAVLDGLWVKGGKGRKEEKKSAPFLYINAYSQCV